MSASPPYWEITIQKFLNTEYWTNVYHCAASSLASAQNVADAIVLMERGLHSDVVTFDLYRVRSYPGPSEGTITPIGEFGAAGTGSYMPLFNVLRVDWRVTSGRPSRKYYRAPVLESWQDNAQLTLAIQSQIAGVLDDFLEKPEFAQMIDVDGQLWVNGIVNPAVGMRQLRRGSRRRALPIIG